MKCYDCGRTDGAHRPGCPSARSTPPPPPDEPRPLTILNWSHDYSRPHDYSRRETLLLPLSSAEPIGPGCIRKVNADVHHLATPRVFWVDCRSASSFLIRDVRIGIMSKMIGMGAIPASMFALRTVGDEVVTPGLRVSWPTIRPSERVELLVHNITEAPAYFLAGLECVTVE